MWRVRLLLPVLAALVLGCLSTKAAAATPQPCVRPAPGSPVTPAPELFSAGGVLSVAFNYTSSVDADGRVLFCFVTPDGLESPTLHVKPGDTLKISLTNTLTEQALKANPAKMNMAPMAMTSAMVPPGAQPCTTSEMYGLSVNIHFHGLNVSPTCHGDEVLTTIVNPGETYAYSVVIPADEPPGLYPYHPHVHTISAPALLGGASGMLIVDGIEAFEPEVAKLPNRILTIRDQQVVGNPPPKGDVPSYDLSLNYTPVDYPALIPGVITMKRGTQEFWRVANASADAVTDLQLTYDGVRQPLKIVALDGVPIGSQDGTRRGTTLSQTDILLPPASRAEFIVSAPPAGVKKAILETLKLHGGPFSDNNTHRTLAVIQAGDGSTAEAPPVAKPVPAVWKQRFDDLATAKVTGHRRLYFFEIVPPPKNGAPVQKDLGNFYITVNGQIPTPFDPSAPPSIITRQGSVEDWIIENRTLEVHEFHIHQIHFLLMERNGQAVATNEQQYLDTVQVPFWSGVGRYPSVKVRMDFRGDTVGDFVYHCHILDHEDLGMMEKIRVLRAKK